MSNATLEEINLYDLHILEGKYYCKNYNNVLYICDKIKFLNCVISFNIFEIKIKKKYGFLKLDILTKFISQDLIYFIDNLPKNIDILVIPQLLISDIKNKIPSTLKRLVICGYDDRIQSHLDDLKKINKFCDVQLKK
jgi:hypothetical protein